MTKHDEDDRCHWNHELGYRTTARHLRGCDLAGCAGCAPCTKTHCTMPRCANHLREHELNICDRCVGKVRDGLQRVVQLCSFAPYVAVTAGIHSEVAFLVGPVADHASYATYREQAIYGRALCRCADCPDLRPEPKGPECRDWKTCDHYVCRRRNGRPTCPGLVDWLEIADGDDRHPLQVLGGWDMTVGTLLGHHRSLRVTVATSAAYLTANLTDLARTPAFDFAALGDEVTECVTYVEQVLLLAEHTETGAPCPVCHAQGRKARPLEKVYGRAAAFDHWCCPRAECGQTWTVDEYDRYVERESVLHMTALTASQIATTYRVAEGTVRRWAAEGKIRRRGYDGQRRQLYDVADVVTCRDEKTDRGA